MNSKPSSKDITFVAVWAYGRGGVPRAVFSLAGELAQRGHNVNVVSVYRTAELPYVDVNPLVKLSWLEDLVDPTTGASVPRARRDPRRTRRDRRLDRSPSSLASETHPAFSALIDEHLEGLFGNLQPGIVIATRPELAQAAVRWRSAGVLVIDAEHLAMEARPTGVREALMSTGAKLDALVTLTEADKEAWLEAYGAERPSIVTVIPNAVSREFTAQPSLERPVIIAAGRLTRQKGFDMLIDAFAPVAATAPGWELHIYGQGRLESQLHEQARSLGLEGRVRLLGFTENLDDRIFEASIFAMSSRYEGFPMVLLEAMSMGLPPVSMDCPNGPGELIRDRSNGLLIGNANIVQLSNALLELIRDRDLRLRLGREARRSIEDFSMTTIANSWESLFRSLTDD